MIKGVLLKCKGLYTNAADASDSYMQIDRIDTYRSTWHLPAYQLVDTGHCTVYRHTHPLKMEVGGWR